MDAERLVRDAVERATARGADYADARLVRTRTEELTVRNGRLAGALSDEDLGLGVRVLVGGSWGFAARPLGEDPAAAPAEAARLALRAAKAMGRAQRSPVQLAGRADARGEYRTPFELDPFEVSPADRLDLLQAAVAALGGRDEAVVREASCSVRREEQWMATSEGGETFQELVRAGAGVACQAAAHGQVERRSYPASFGGNYLAAGWEHVLGMDLVGEAPRVRDEAIALCSAPPCPPGRRDLILSGNQLMLQIHESVGHPTELDRVHGHEVDLAGSSFATTDKLGAFEYGSRHVDLVADSTVPGGLDTRGFDDDGVPSQRWHVVREGRLEGYLTSREWAGRVGEAASRGSNRAEGWFHPPIVRITNLSLMPGTWTLDDLIADTADGVYCDTVKTWSIDPSRMNFQFTTELGWEIVDGERRRLLRSPTYQGSTPEFWRSCDAVCDERHWRLWGVPNCGKGNPMQVAEMSHGAAPARFRGVEFVGGSW